LGSYLFGYKGGSTTTFWVLLVKGREERVGTLFEFFAIPKFRFVILVCGLEQDMVSDS
jgi:hypothetical protein